jgi:hypothetical protein
MAAYSHVVLAVRNYVELRSLGDLRNFVKVGQPVQKFKRGEGYGRTITHSIVSS